MLISVNPNHITVPEWRCKNHDEERIAKIASYIKAHGQLKPVIICELIVETEGGPMPNSTLLDGYNILQACIRLQTSCWAINTGTVVNQTSAELISLQLNLMPQDFNLNKLSKTLNRLSKETSIDFLVSKLPFKPNFIQDMVDMADFDFNKFDDKKDESQLSIFDV